MRPSILLLLLATQIAFGQTRNVKLFEFANSTCNEELDPGKLRTRIIEKTLSGRILTVKIASTATCCVSFEPKTSFKNGILFLDLEETGRFCSCDCCYEFTFKIDGIKDANLKIKFRNRDIEYSTEKLETYPITFELFNGDTINHIDKYGLKQGKWIESRDGDIILQYSNYVNDKMIKAVRVYPNQKIKIEVTSEQIEFKVGNKQFHDYADLNLYIEYYESGAKKKECYNSKKESSNSFMDGRCKEWNEKGELIYDGDFRK